MRSFFDNPDLCSCPINEGLCADERRTMITAARLHEREIIELQSEVARLRHEYHELQEQFEYLTVFCTEGKKTQ